MKTVVGLFDVTAHAEKAMRDLEAIGIPHSDLSLAANNDGGQYPVHGASGTTEAGHDSGSEARKGALEGAGVGVVLGLAALAVPGLGWLAVGGWLATIATGAVVGAAVGLTGALVGVGVPHEEASLYNEGVRRGGTLLAVKSPDDKAQQVAEILGDNDAVDIDERADLYKQDGFIPTAAPLTASAGAAAGVAAVIPPTQQTHNAASVAAVRSDKEGEVVLPVMEENLRVGKREVERGAVRVYTHITDTPVEEQVTLREEHINVERHPVDRPVTAMDSNFKEGSFELHERAEEAVVAKDARVVEEVVIGKEASQHIETVRDTVRRTDVSVEEIPGGTHSASASETTAVVGNGVPGIQTGGHDADGSPDTRGISEKVADTLTGDRIDDKTGKPVA